MSIRPRITKAYTDELKDYERRRLRGPVPPAPPKPTKAEREQFVIALRRVPVGEIMPTREFFAKVRDYYALKKFECWGVEVCIMPGWKHLLGDNVECTGATVRRAQINKRGVKLMCRLRGDPKTWYGQVIRWIGETEYEW